MNRPKARNEAAVVTRKNTRLGRRPSSPHRAMAHCRLPGAVARGAARDLAWNRGALCSGGRGLPGGSSLAQLLAKHRQYRNLAAMPLLSIPQILAWADAYHHRKGQWPNKESGPVAEAPAENWNTINAALRIGRRGLRGGLTLAKLLAECRGYQPAQAAAQLPPDSGVGRRALSADGGLADGRLRSARGRAERELVADRSCSASRPARPAVAAVAGPVPRETPRQVPPHDSAAALGRASAGMGQRAPPSHGAMAVERFRGGGRGPHRALEYDQLFAAQGPSRAAGGAYPDQAIGRTPRPSPAGQETACGPANPGLGRLAPKVHGEMAHVGLRPRGNAPGETWRAVNTALLRGLRGLQCHISLARLLESHRGKPYYGLPPPLSTEKILAWADDHRRRTGRCAACQFGRGAGGPGRALVGNRHRLAKGRPGPAGRVIAQPSVVRAPPGNRGEGRDGLLMTARRGFQPAAPRDTRPRGATAGRRRA